MPGPPRFSVIVPTRGREPGLVALLDALARQTLPPDRFEVIVVFDGAVPGASSLAAAGAVGAQIERLAGRRGPGAARNAGARAARGEVLAFTEDDVVPAPDWLARAAERLAAAPELDVLEGLTLKPGRRPVRIRAVAGLSYLPTNLFVRRECFERSGGYQEAFFDPKRGIYFREDADLGFTLEEAGAQVAIEERAVVIHPVEHPGWLDPLRWARRYQMDALLAARHPRRFRERIEVHRIGPLRIRRPILRAAAAYVAALVAAALAWTGGVPGVAAASAAIAFVAFLPLWAKWRFDLVRLPVYLLVPFVLITAWLRGHWRIRGSRRPSAVHSSSETPA
jgi:GT2 family glycosyltransferase